MFGVLFSFILASLMALATLLFGVLSFYHKKPVYLAMGVISAIIGLIIGFLNADYFIYGFQNGLIMLLAPTTAWIFGIVFLILSKSSKKSENENDTTDYLNDIINAEDEDWDPES